MAKAEIVHRYPDGSATAFSVKAEAEHPDVFDEIVSRVLRMYRETVLEDAGDDDHDR